MIERVMAKPKPSPPNWRVIFRLPCSKASKMRPLVRVEPDARVGDANPERMIAIVARGNSDDSALGGKLPALRSTFQQACWTRTGSPVIRASLAFNSTWKVRFLARASASTISSARRRTGVDVDLGTLERQLAVGDQGQVQQVVDEPGLQFDVCAG
jgi:hypothetical protein